MTATAWSQSEPPIPGWYTASKSRDTNFLRYWNGARWSAPVHTDDMAIHSERARQMPGESPGEIEWQNVESRPDPIVKENDNSICPCEPGKCAASAEGARVGRMSVISDVRCKATIPGPGAYGGLEPGAMMDIPPGCRVQVLCPDPEPNASMMLGSALKRMAERALEYDKPGGERSMAATVAAFNAVTGQSLSESEGWMFMECLKAVRDFTTPGGHADSQEDRIAYAALGAEARRGGR